MEEGCSSGGPAVNDVSPGEAASQTKQSCSSCGLPTKGHPGPVGESKCLVGMLNVLSKRVEELEERDKACADQLKRQ